MGWRVVGDETRFYVCTALIKQNIKRKNNSGKVTWPQSGPIWMPGFWTVCSMEISLLFRKNNNWDCYRKNHWDWIGAFFKVTKKKQSFEHVSKKFWKNFEFLTKGRTSHRKLEKSQKFSGYYMQENREDEREIDLSPSYRSLSLRRIALKVSVK